VRNVEEYLAAKHFNGRKLAKRASCTFEPGYAPELDTTPELDAELHQYYQSQIGVLRWMVESGRVDMNTEVSLLTSQMAMPREGHLEAVFRMFAYLKQKQHNSRMVFVPTYPTIDMSKFVKVDWQKFNGDVKEAVPRNAPEPLDKEMDLRLFVD
jgi:hypothetical protein